MPEKTPETPTPSPISPKPPTSGRDPVQRIHGRVLVDGAAPHRESLVVRATASILRADSLSRRVSSEGPVHDDGRFELVLPVGARLDEVAFQVRDADGSLLHETVVPSPTPNRPVELHLTRDPLSRREPKPEPLAHPTPRLQGRVLDRKTGRPVARSTVILWGRVAEAAEDVALVAVETNSRGAFFVDRPAEQFVAAHATVPPHELKTPLQLDADGRLPTRVLIILDVVEPEVKQDACGCDAPPTSTPSTEDFVASPDSFAQDLGPGCVSFTRPHRSLHEKRYFYIVRTTEPKIQGFSAQPLKIPLDPGFMPRQRDAASGPTTLRPDTARALLASNVELTPEHLASAVKSDLSAGFGDKLLSLMKPSDGRDRLDADNPVDWDSTPTFSQATTIAHGHLLEFRQQWRSAGYSLGSLLYSLPLAPGQKRQIAVLDWTRDEQAQRAEDVAVEEHLDAVLDHDRQLRESSQALLTEELDGSSKTTTRGFGIGKGSAGAGEYMGFTFGGSLGVGGGRGISETDSHQESSRALTATASQQLREHTSQAANAVRKQRSTVVQSSEQSEHVEARTEVVANYNHCHAITMEYFEILRHIEVSQELIGVRECLFIPLLLSHFDELKVLRWQALLRQALLDPRLDGAFDAVARLRSGMYADLPATFDSLVVKKIVVSFDTRTSIERPRDKDNGFDEDAWAPLAELLPASARSVFERYLLHAENRDEAFGSALGVSIGSALTRHFRARLRSIRAEPDVDCAVRVREATTLPASGAWGLEFEITPRAAITRGELDAILLGLDRRLRRYVRLNVDRIRLRYHTALGWRTLPAELLRPSLGFGITDLLGDFDEAIELEVKSGLDEDNRIDGPDRRLARKLIEHLNANIEYYHRAIWWRMDPARRYMLLDGFEAPNAHGRSVASVVENRVVDIVGNCLIMPVASGVHLDPTVPKDVDLLTRYHGGPTSSPLWITMPTPGVYAEAVMGACNSCEFKDERRFWRWEESPLPDNPTAITPVSLNSRRSDPGDLSPGGLPAPVVTIQNTPAAPDPIGLGAALYTLAKANAFRDATGLNQNQLNALGALTSSLSTAQAFGQMATDLVKAKLGAIKEAQTQGHLTQAEADERVKAALDEMPGPVAASSQGPSEEGGGSLGAPESASGRTAAGDLASVDLGSLMQGVLRQGGTIEAQDAPYRVKLVSAGTDEPLNSDDYAYSLGASVGRGGVNRPEDVLVVKARLRELGYSWVSEGDRMDQDTIGAIRLFQSAIHGQETVDGDARIDVPAPTATSLYRWLQADNAPRWSQLGAGSRDDRTLGYYNFDIEQSDDGHSGTDWAISAFEAAASSYATDYLASHADAAVLEVTEMSSPRGGKRPRHGGHQTGLMVDIRLPRLDGTAGSITYESLEFDRDAARAMLQALRVAAPGCTLLFNDPTLIAEGLCRHDPPKDGKVQHIHDNHIHFRVPPPAIGTLLTRLL